MQTVFRPLLALALANATLTAGAVTASTQDANVGTLQRNIAEIERRGGALAPALSEHLLGLGLAHRANGETRLALAAIERALHVNRVNKGLHHLVHVPIVDLLIDTYIDAGDPVMADRRQRFRYWLHRRELDPSEPAFTSAALRFANWQINMVGRDTGVGTYRKISDAVKALQRAKAGITQGTPNTDGDLLPVLNAQADAYLKLAIYASERLHDLATRGQRDDVGELIELRNLITTSYLNGREALSQVIEMTKSHRESPAHGLALANLGDWSLAFGRPPPPAKLYTQAFIELKNAGLSDEELAKEMGQPRRLNRFTLERRIDPDLTQDPIANAFVTATLKVSKNGRVGNLEIVAARPAGNARILRDARANLRRSRFRPGISAEGPVASTATVRLIFPDESI